MATAEKAIWFQTGTEQLDALSLEVCEELQLAPTRYALAVERYGVVNQAARAPGKSFSIFPSSDFSARLYGFGDHE